LLNQTKLDEDKITNVFDSENFRTQGHQIIDLLADYLKDISENKITKVLPSICPDKMLENWANDFKNPTVNNIEEIIKDVVSQSNHLHHPHYIGRQVSPPLPAAALCDFVSSFLNNGSAIFEMGPVNTAMEKNIINWMANLVGFGIDSDGFLTSGGTLGNLTALLAARQIKSGENTLKTGLANHIPLCMLVSEQSHYSIKKAAQIMGIGDDGVIKVSVDENYCIDINALKSSYEKAVNEGKKVISVVANACSTSTGSYDPIDVIADFCEEHDLWLHVDGAHGASALLSEKYKYLLKGIERADSVIWDAHKMLLMPTLITAVLFKNGGNSYKAFSQKASYLFNESSQNWYDLALRTLECNKGMMGLKLYTSLSMYGQDFFSDYVTKMYDLTRKFAAIVENSDDFELAIQPQSNIICFRYLPKIECNLNEIQKEIRKKIIESGLFYIVQTDLKGTIYLRCTIINPLTTENDLIDLLKQIRGLVYTY